MHLSISGMLIDPGFQPLASFLARVPGIRSPIGTGTSEKGRSWVKFAIDIAHPLAWHVVQELGHVLNYLSIEERLPTVFKPVSPPPDMNGGPGQFLSWVIECEDPGLSPAKVAQWLEGRLPRPVTDQSEWLRE
jgi:hypothetical protein